MSDQWMGLIAAQDQYRPLGNDPWTNTMAGTRPAPGQGFEPVQQSPVLYNTKAGPITEADIENTMGVAMGVSGGGLATKGIKAYHSSPHDFDKFDLAKIGTGEGAQVYGHGLYFAENPAVSGQGGQYWDQFKSRFKGPESTAATELKLSKFDRELAQRSLSEEINRLIDRGESPGVIANRTEALRLLESGKPVGPRTYEVNINADPAHMLDWDKPLREQQHLLDKLYAAKVTPKSLDTASLAKYGDWGEMQARYINDIAGQPGADIYRKAGVPTEATAALREAGIPGIKYFDQGSRGAFVPASRQHMYKPWGGHLDVPKPSSNYVIFDPNLITIEKKYGIPAAIGAGGMGALAAQDNYQPEERM